ncbi:hypothetical protein DPMN_151968 [Dreissena polymorpha]|uniref:Uncharacterized protein n=1 Tax=Dreissena polymorpha TaxID=45954 RepID=A0A9D4FG16_DREPO|nr:hypothetical protein DPMN_151968 [Dreissena polymorpha]
MNIIGISEYYSGIDVTFTPLFSSPEHNMVMNFEDLPGLVRLPVIRLDEGKREFDRRWGYEALESIKENTLQHFTMDRVNARERQKLADLCANWGKFERSSGCSSVCRRFR